MKKLYVVNEVLVVSFLFTRTFQFANCLMEDKNGRNWRREHLMDLIHSVHTESIITDGVNIIAKAIELLSTVTPDHDCFKSTDVLGSVQQSLRVLIWQMNQDASLKPLIEKHLIMHHNILAPVIDEYHTGERANSLPWGTNWYEFTIMYPRVFVYYIIETIKLFQASKDLMGWDLDEFLKFAEFFCQLIIRINPTTDASVFLPTIKRYGPNLFQMAYTHMFAAIYLNEFDFDFFNDKLQTIDQFYFIKPVMSSITDNKEGRYDGTYIDYTFVFHRNVRAYGYLLESIDMEWLFGALLNKNHEDAITFRITKEFIHPNINRLGWSLFNRNGIYILNNQMPAYKRSKDALPFVKYFPIGHLFVGLYRDYVIQFALPVERLAIHEYDRGNDGFLLPSMFGRRMQTNSTIEQFKPEYARYEPGVLYYENFPELPPSIDVKSVFSVNPWSEVIYAKGVDENDIIAMVSHIEYDELNILDYIIVTPAGIVRYYIGEKRVLNQFPRIDMTIDSHEVGAEDISANMIISPNQIGKVQILLHGNIEATVVTFDKWSENNVIGFGYVNHLTNSPIRVDVTHSQEKSFEYSLHLKITINGKIYTFKDEHKNIHGIYNENDHAWKLG